MSDNTSVNLDVSASAAGSVRVASDVLATIAGLALTEVEGVANTLGFSALLAEKLTKRSQPNNIKNITRGIKVEVNDKDVSVTVNIMVEYGYSVQEVSRNIQEGIKKTIETMTGMNVSSVDVHVNGLSFEMEEKTVSDLEHRNYLPDSRKPDEGNRSKDSEQTLIETVEDTQPQ